MGKKKIVIVCALLASCLLLNALLSGRIDRSKAYAAAGQDPNAPTASGLPNLNALDLTGDHGSRYDLVKQFTYAVLLVTILGAGAWYLSRKLVPRLTTARGRNIAVIESVPLGPNKMLHLVEVGARRLLVGSTSQTVNFLADVSASNLPPDASLERQVEL